MKRLLIFTVCFFAAFMLCACAGGPGEAALPEVSVSPSPSPSPTPEPYMWTITIDDDCLQNVYGITVNSHCRASLYKVGGDEFGAYSGEIFMDFTADMGEWASLLEMVGGIEYDLDGEAGNSAFSMELVPYDGNEISAFAASSRDSGEDTEERATGRAMWITSALDLPEGDQDMFLNMNFTGVASVSGTGDLNEGEGNMDSLFGSAHSESSREGMPCTIVLMEDGSVVLTLYSTGGSAYDIIYTGTIDRVFLSSAATPEIEE